MGVPFSARTPPWVERRRTCLPPSASGAHPIPAFWDQPKRFPEGSPTSISGVIGNEPAGPGAWVRTSKIAGFPESKRSLTFIWTSLQISLLSVHLKSLSHMPGQATESHPKPGTVAIYPGSFDPLTNGHMDVIARGSKLVHHLIVAVLTNTQKASLFNVSERLEIIKHATADLPNVEVGGFEGLLVDYAARQNATVVIRGIRAISDYENELQMALLNRRMR